TIPLRSDHDSQHLLELEDGGIPAGFGGLESRKRLRPNPVPQGWAEPGAAAAASKMKQQGKKQVRLHSQKTAKATRTLGGKAAQAAAEKPQPATASSVYDMQQQPAAAAGAGKATLCQPF